MEVASNCKVVTAVGWLEGVKLVVRAKLLTPIDFSLLTPNAGMVAVPAFKAALHTKPFII